MQKWLVGVTTFESFNDFDHFCLTNSGLLHLQTLVPRLSVVKLVAQGHRKALLQRMFRRLPRMKCHSAAFFAKTPWVKTIIKTNNHKVPLQHFVSSTHPRHHGSPEQCGKQCQGMKRKLLAPDILCRCVTSVCTRCFFVLTLCPCNMLMALQYVATVNTCSKKKQLQAHVSPMYFFKVPLGKHVQHEQIATQSIVNSSFLQADFVHSEEKSLILLLGLDPWPLDPLDPPKFFKDFLFFKKF